MELRRHRGDGQLTPRRVAGVAVRASRTFCTLAETLPEDEAAAADGEPRRTGMRMRVGALLSGLLVLDDAVGEEVETASDE